MIVAMLNVQYAIAISMLLHVRARGLRESSRNMSSKTH